MTYGEARAIVIAALKDALPQSVVGGAEFVPEKYRDATGEPLDTVVYSLSGSTGKYAGVDGAPLIWSPTVTLYHYDGNDTNEYIDMLQGIQTMSLNTVIVNRGEVTVTDEQAEPIWLIIAEYGELT